MHLLVNKNPHFQNNDNGYSERELCRIVAKATTPLRITPGISPILSIRKKIGEGTNTRMGAWKGRRRMSFLWCKAKSLKPSHQSQREQDYPRVRQVIIIELFSTPLSPSPWLKRYSNTLLKSHLNKNTKSVTLSILCRTRSINQTILHVFQEPNRLNRGGRIIKLLWILLREEMTRSSYM